ncbi:branched-chain amino acid ABC transporter permease (plasmid) [Aliisedimentitalea scapharcae]|uniref:Branched-chain amino acid ABC transporter permease n=1 Tax=Aliisedimentitalea scapharcae TaxID=1524259 RepID=A0ABZ2XYT8_9RHOB
MSDISKPDTSMIASVFTGKGLVRDSLVFWAVIAGLAMLGAVLGDSYVRHIFILVFIWCIVIASWDLILGYAGIFNYAQLVFFTFGAYGSAMLSIYAGFTPLLSILSAAAIGAVIGVVIAIPSLRLKGEYVALFTFAVHLALPPLIQQGKAIGMGGNTGLLGIPWLNLFGFQVSSIDKLTWYWVSLFLGALCVWLIYFIVLRGRMGLAFVAMRDADTFAQAIGVNEYKYKLLAFVVSAVFTAVAGGIYAHYTSVVTPKILGTEFFLMAMVMLAIGGMGRFPGAILGVFLVVIGNELLRSFDDYRLLLLGVVVVVTVICLPRGIAGLFERQSKQP